MTIPWELVDSLSSSFSQGLNGRPAMPPQSVGRIALVVGFFGFVRSCGCSFGLLPKGNCLGRMSDPFRRFSGRPLETAARL